jgi:glycosyltransferase involved in cell wall biosynthesis
VRLLCVLNGGIEHPSSRLRVMQHVERLKAGGIDADVFVAKGRKTADLADLARRARRSDAVLVQKKLFARWKLPLLLGSAPLLFDLDDAVFAVSPDERERFGEERAERRAASRRGRLAAVLRRSRVAIVGNRYLAEHAARFTRQVAVVPTAVDLGPFPAEALRRARETRRSRPGGPRVGWLGSRPSLRYLPALAEPLRRVLSETGGVFVQICSEFADLPGVPAESITWSLAGEAEALLGLDVGVMPLDDSPFSQGKCGLKILMYQAAGLPVVCSPVGANRDLVRENETGFFARSADEWAAHLRRLLGDPSLALRLGERGRAQVEEGYEASSIAARLMELVKGAARREPAA